MLRSWRDEVRVALTPQRVTLARITGRWRRTLVSKRSFDVVPTTSTDWYPSAELFEHELRDAAWQRADITIVLSNHFVRYALVPWSAALTDDVEQLAWVKHHFSELYGDAESPLDYRWSEGGPDVLCIASAVDSELIARIQGACAASAHRLKSVQPYLMAAFNRSRARIGDRAAWIVVVESGRCCVAAVAEGEWLTLTCVACAEWQTDLPRILRRERLRCPDTEPTIVVAHVPEPWAFGANDWGDIPLHAVAPRPLHRYSPDTDRVYAMALTGVV